ncbi:MAG TPA: DUF5606 domain-containing protein [Saprospiraceae bacterium]|nr:DUF5606 domain-containing protein [Saprospiraceae bacterium]
MENYLDNIVAVSGVPGLMFMETNRSNGLILKDMDSGKKQFYSVRKHQFTPLRSIAIYTYDDSTPIDVIFEKLNSLKTDNNISDILKSDNRTIANFFRNVLPDYDEDRVYPSDMKKVLKWFDFLDKRNVIVLGTDQIDSSEEE